MSVMKVTLLCWFTIYFQGLFNGAYLTNRDLLNYQGQQSNFIDRNDFNFFGTPKTSHSHKIWAETSSTRDDNLALGNPSNAKTSIQNPDNYLMVKSQFSLSYNNSRGIANWVSWHLSSSWKGEAKRCNCFKPDTELPESFFRVIPSMYKNTGFDKGHLCPSDDRDGSDQDNAATFLMSNMIPQAPNNNQITWNRFEGYCRDLLKQGNELYVISGGSGSGGIGRKGIINYTLANGKINVPAKTWKIVVVIPEGNNDLKRITNQTRVIAIDVPNTQSASSKPWFDYRTTIDQIEKQTGFDFLSLVPLQIQTAIESRQDQLLVN